MKSIFYTPLQSPSHFATTLQYHFLQDPYLYLRIFYFFLFVFYILSGFDAFAADDDPIGNQLCKVFTVLEGNTAKVIGGTAMCGVAASTLSGKISWTTCGTTTIGIFLIFAAPKVVGFLSGSDAACVEI
jgi:type IV secretory pathway VirB2 component (pilin)